LHVATATVEHAFLAMNIINTEMRNKLNDDWVDDSMCATLSEAFLQTLKMISFWGVFMVIIIVHANCPKPLIRLSELLVCYFYYWI
jgi:hypothetical protein